MKKRIVKTKPRIDLGISVFENLLSLAFSDFSNKGFFKKLDKFFENVDTTVYTQDVDILPRFTLLDKYIRCILDENITNTELIFEYVIENTKNIDEVDKENIINDILEKELNLHDATNIENSMIDRMNFFNAESDLNKLKSLINEWEKGTYSSYSEIILNIQKVTHSFNKKIYSRSQANSIIDYLDFSENNFKEKMNTIHREITNEKRLIKTGVQRLNAALSGGFAPGRVYLFLGITGGWKSGLLLNIAFWALKFNKDVPCRDMSRRPAYVYITQENDIYETVERAYSYIGATDKSNSVLKDFENAFTQFNKEFHTDYGTIILIYRKKNHFNTLDLDSLLTDIEQGGEYEIKMVIHDYLKRIQPANPKNDLRIDLGEATNDFSNIAKERRIPFITANQLNRDAYKVIESGSFNESMNKKNNMTDKKDLGRGINLSMQSESSQISENVDSIFAIVKEHSEVLDSEYLCFSDLKQRFHKGKRTKSSSYFAHPFEKNNSMRLIEDIHDKVSSSLNNITGAISNFSSSSTPQVVEEDTLSIEDVFGN